MAAVMRELLASPLAGRYAMVAIPTFRPAGKWGRLRVAAAGLVALVAFCLRPGPRLVHIHAAVRGSFYRKGVYVLVARGLHCPVIFHLHAGVGDIDAWAGRLGPLRRRAFARGLRIPDRVLSVSLAGAARLGERFGRTDVEVVPNPAPHLEPEPEPAGGAPGVLYLGGFQNPVKGGSDLVAALPALARTVPDVEVVLAGPGAPSPAEARVIGAAGARWAGWLGPAAKARALGEAGVVVFPSVSEGLPVALLEAMAHGRAIVATRVGGMPDVLTDGEDARLIAPSDPAALAAALARLSADGPERTRLGAAARARALRLTAAEVTGRLAVIYQEVLNRRGGG